MSVSWRTLTKPFLSSMPFAPSLAVTAAWTNARQSNVAAAAMEMKKMLDFRTLARLSGFDSPNRQFRMTAPRISKGL
jgi:hypothetical protein